MKIRAIVAAAVSSLLGFAPGASAATEFGTLAICASGNGLHPARLAVFDANRHLIRVTHLRRGCLTLRVGDLPAGQYLVRYRAPDGRLAAVVGVSSLSRNPDIGAATRSAGTPRKITNIRFTLDPDSSGVIQVRGSRCS